MLNHISAAIRDATHRPFEIGVTITPVSGGDINATYRLTGVGGESYFLKLNDACHHETIVAESIGLDAIGATNTLRVPRPIVHGSVNGKSYLVLEYLKLSPRGNARQLGEQLAALHRCVSGNLNGLDVINPTFGFMHDNFIGTTRQSNDWTHNWISFWREQRLALKNGYGGQLQRLGETLLDVLADFFVGYTPQPSLLHGDLWGGNHAFLSDGTPTIFDPASYYGDRECDLAMTDLFGGYSANFYAAYRATYPLDDGYATRRDLYNLYHILNHANLFGGGYVQQAAQMMRRLLAEVKKWGA
jgi:fructosamine-3-kinase